MSLDISGIWVALVTPFDASPLHGIDHAALRRLVRHLGQAGVTGLVALGSTGEAAALDDAEQDAVLDTVLDAAQGLPVIAGLAGNHVGHLHQRLAHYNTLPIKAVLSPAPYYVRPSQAALIAHFQALAEASRAPIVLYDIPYRTGVPMTQDTLLTLAAHPNIVGIKDCGGAIDKTQALIADGRLQVLAGEDHLAFHNLCLGGAGAISAVAQVVPQAFMAMYHALRAGRLRESLPWQHRMAGLIQALYAEPNPSVIKHALHMQDLIGPALRPPLLAASDAAQQRMAQAWRSFDGG